MAALPADRQVCPVELDNPDQGCGREVQSVMQGERFPSGCTTRWDGHGRVKIMEITQMVLTLMNGNNTLINIF